MKHKSKKTKNILLVTGLSGAGLSTALKALEDQGYTVFDNLPLAMIDPILKRKEAKESPIAIGIDARTWDFDVKKIAQKAKDINARFLFIDCQDHILQRRFTETRRVHPLAKDRPVADGVARERRLFAQARKLADFMIDTTDLKAQDLRQLIAGHYATNTNQKLILSVMSFGFKNGLPREADLVFDVRFLDNPHWNPKLRPLTGLDGPIQKKIGQDADFISFFSNLKRLLGPLLPLYHKDGKNYLTIAIGCTGGKHRSVFTAESLGEWLRTENQTVTIRHRDLEQAAIKARTTKEAKRKKTS